MTEYEAQILAFQKFPDEKKNQRVGNVIFFWISISHKREREKYVKELLKR